jgi:hypothetical protein
LQVYKETIWHFTCQSCNGFWTVAASDKWEPKELFCTHCGSKRTHDKELVEWVGGSDYIPKNQNINLEFLLDENYSEDEICSCGHKVLECDCAAGCECGCRNRYLKAY